MSKRISIITPVFNEEEGLDHYRDRVSEVLLDREGEEISVLFIDDGSSDGSWKKIISICESDERFSAIRLSRNFGSHIAISAGFQHVDGDAVAVLACDLQDPPEVVAEFIEKWRVGAQIVWGHRRKREDSAWRAATSKMFNFLISRYAMPPGSKFATGSFLLCDRRVVDGFNQFPEHNRITFALVAWTGFEQEIVLYDRAQRTTGKSGWTFSKMIKAMYDTFVGFSLVPVRLITALGAALFILAGSLSVYVLVLRILGDPVPGWSGIMFVLSLFLAIQFLVLGIMGEYLYRIYSEVVRRPLYFVSEVLNVGERTVVAAPPSARVEEKA